MNQYKAPITTCLFITALFILGFLIYSNSLYSPFIFDDEGYIATNYWIRDISNFKDLGFTIYGGRYVGLLSFAVNYYFGGLNTFGYHLVNIIIHILNAILVYFLIQAMGNRLEAMGVPRPSSTVPSAHRLLPIACSLIFLVHPIQTQAVTYITQRFASLAAFFYLLAIVLYIKARGYGQRRANNLSPIAYCLSLFSTILAMKTKEISFTLPFIIILYEFVFFSRNNLRHATSNYKRFLHLLPYLLTLIIIPLTLFSTNADISQNLKDAQLKDMTNLSKYYYLLTQFSVIVTYIRLLFCPVHQNFDYDYPISHSIFEPATFLSFILLLSIFVFAIYLYLRSRKTNNGYGLLVSFGILWFFITLSVESSIIPIKDVIFEHRVYLPSIGAIIAFNTGLFYGIEYAKIRLSIKTSVITIFLSLTIIFATIFSIAVYKRNFIWGDLMTMAIDMLNKSPGKPDVLNNIGGLYYGRGLLDKAKDKLEKAISIDPDFFLAHNNIGLVYLKKGLLEDAEMAFKRAIKIEPNYSDAHENLGDIYLEKTLWSNALREYETAVMIKETPRLYNKIGALYLKLGDRDTAIKAFKEAVRLEPQSLTPYTNMGFAYFEKGDYDKSMEMHEKALKIDPKFANAHYGLAEVYEKKGIKDKAAEHYKGYIKYADPKEQFVERAKKKIAESEAE